MHRDDLGCYHVLHWLTGLLQPRTYLEVGVREGGSLCSVLGSEPEIVAFASTCLDDGRTHLTDDIIQRIHEGYTSRDPTMQLYLFDNWSYDGGDGGHDRVTRLLDDGFHHHCYALYDGDSKDTLPPFLDTMKAPLDLVFVDGDHTLDGATADLENLAGRFKVLVMHDLVHPQHSYLEAVFTRYVRSHGYPSVIVGRRAMGTGVAFNMEG